MNAITLWQPWAQFMAINQKTFETRSRPTKYRGDICIHAARFMPVVTHCIRRRMEAANLVPEGLPRGRIIAVVELYDCLPTVEVREEARSFGEVDLGDYSPGRFAYLTRKLRKLQTPVPCRGYQSIAWEVPEEVAAQVEAQLSAIRGAALMDQNHGRPMFGGTV